MGTPRHEEELPAVNILGPILWPALLIYSAQSFYTCSSFLPPFYVTSSKITSGLTSGITVHPYLIILSLSVWVFIIHDLKLTLKVKITSLQFLFFHVILTIESFIVAYFSLCSISLYNLSVMILIQLQEYFLLLFFFKTEYLIHFLVFNHTFIKSDILSD